MRRLSRHNTLRTRDADILSLRVHLADDSFIEAFFNTTTERVSFAPISGGQRVYGKDNAKIGWHEHPADAPQLHRCCAPVSFEEFLAEVIALRFAA
jgi:hypothetical protein